MIRFQYKMVPLQTFKEVTHMVNAFSHLGQQGWEAVGVFETEISFMGFTAGGFALFKRQVPEGEEPLGEWAEWIKSKNVGKEPTQDELHKNDPNWGAW